MTKLLVRILRIATMVFAFLFSAAITLGIVMEKYPAPLDAAFDTLSSEIVSEETDEADWIYQSKFKTAKEAFEGLKEFAIRESHETFALLKNEGNALPISKTAKITMMGLRSYAPVYGNSGGSIADKKTVETGNQIYKAFADNGFQLNPSMLKAYENYAATLTWGGKGFGATPPEYQGLAVTNDVPELSIAELASYNDAFDSEYDNYDDAAIIVVGRPGGESKNYYPGAEGLIEGLETTTGNILGLSTEEKEIIEEAKDNFDKVIVLVNSTMMMELGELEADPEIDAVMWIGYPGAYGFHGVADVLCGDKTPSAHLGDIYATNTAVAPAMMNFGNIPWANKSQFASGENVNGYLINAEGIYSGYRYYETRYADVVAGVSSAKTAKAGTYTGSDYKIATTDGVWDYAHEVVYPFGYGLSYTTFEQKLDSVEIMGDKRSAKVTVTVKNTGDTYSGKSVIQLYGQAPYEHGTTKVEKSAIQLLDFEKTKELKPGDSQTITMNVDLANIASYDSKDAKTFILDEGTYFMAIGDDSHDALNNILAAKGYDEADGMTEDGDKTKAYSWNWGYDADTFSVSYKGVEITNRLSDGIYSMDINTFLPGTVTYMTRSNFNGTFPKTYSGLTATGDLVPLLKNDFIQLKTDADTSKYQWGVKGDLTLNDMKGAEFNDPRWASLVDQVPIEEFLTFASKAFHNIQEIPSVQYMGHNADDGPGGSDNHYLEEGSYQGTPYADAEEYKGFGTRVAPTPTNLAYSWNKELAFENGEIILGESTLVLNLPIMIGPGMNMHRHAYNGRGGEYYSEDPILSGYIGSAVIQGAQSK
ncbi:MAG: glycoside hydrolase family 3 C-terminal domain-containing protein, partial [Clostridia bacterium]|nr:glycoside hydrolase family 3 C-terminal domain-containing protein [Clostridia bacterium]